MVSVGERMGILPVADMEFEALGDGMTKFTRTSIFTRKRNSMVLPIAAIDVLAWQQGRTMIQNAFPQLDADQREFLMSGATPEEWNMTFGGCD